MVAAQCADYCLPYNSFSELIMSRDQKMITGLYHISAEHARLSKANARNEIDYLVYSMHYAFGTAQNDLNRIAIPLYKWYDKEKFFNDLQGKNSPGIRGFQRRADLLCPRLVAGAVQRKLAGCERPGAANRAGDADESGGAEVYYCDSGKYFIVRHTDWTGYDNETAADHRCQSEGYQRLPNGPDALFKSIAYVFKENEVSGRRLVKSRSPRWMIRRKAARGCRIAMLLTLRSYRASEWILRRSVWLPRAAKWAPEAGAISGNRII